ncbi:hypothetical protein CC85DRAFT_310687 [Cutaneotrichosporon oleaginosum]|uniref:Uncharacterized protein n=1 Tax=Cutaneotrichosporon oleaginosum TaxID=879819 RepID=A0A0J0XVY9_9TREE|nr:uncharacterized protein CC85DRAFT_310687 [Cutaneotrichosporon oleaginosum]KLT45260.1 hypothetical protein CC85DRAFT_310687 [Cutaneotrichosporon oleaginosum]TXT14910.1 hypothetical protein COLE_01103 [Cutaneotrichosporon oleaginosum]
MSLTVLAEPGHNTPTMGNNNSGRSSGHSRGGSWVSDNNQPIWSGLDDDNAPSSSSSTSLRPPSANPLRPTSFGRGCDHTLLAPPPAQFDYTRSTSIRTIAMGGAASRSRVSMDALPADDSDREDVHLDATPSSSTASLPLVDAERPPPAEPFMAKNPQPKPVLVGGGPHPVGLGLPTFVGGTGRPDWPVVRDIVDEGDSEEEDQDADQHEMDTYQSGHRAPVDATLRSMRGVVALGDGWASGASPARKKRWFRRNKAGQSPPVEDDPLALWNVPPSPTAPASPVTATTAAAAANDPNAKWWRSRRNLFTSQKNIASHPEGSAALASPLSHAPAWAETRASNAGPAAKNNRPSWVNRSRLHFGSMVDLGRHDKRKPSMSGSVQAMASTAATNTTTTTTTTHHATSTSPPTTTPSAAVSSGLFGPDRAAANTPAKTFARHSMGGLVRSKAPPHPLELSHQKDRSAASSQPAIPSASTSQPSFFPSPSLEHPLLRMSYARSESHLAGNAVPFSPGIPPPRPVVDAAGPLKGSSMPSWRPPVMSPTTLVEVEEEDEEDDMTRPTLKRTATFGDDDPKPLDAQPAARPAPVVSQPPDLDTVQGSPPQETQRTLSFNESSHSAHESAKTNSSLLGRIKNALSRGRKHNSAVSRKAASVVSASTAPESPRSCLSEQPLPTTPTRASLLPPPRSVGHQGVAPPPHRRSRLWSLAGRGGEDGGQGLGLATKASSKLSAGVDKRNYRVSKHVVESMINLSPSSNADTFGRASATSSTNPSPNPNASRRTSWTPGGASVRLGDEDDASDLKAERRQSRVSLRRFKSQSKQRPALGSVFPRPPDSVDQPPSLHWAFPGSYSTPMLHKFGGSTLSLALDISSTPNNGMSLDDIQESPVSPKRRSTYDDGRTSPGTQRERALSATLTSLTARSAAPPTAEPPAVLHGIPMNARGGRNSIPVNIDNLTNSSDSLSLPINQTVNFPLPPSSSGDLSSPDPDQIEQLRTPQDGMAHDYCRERDDASDESGSSGSGSSRRLRKAPSWSTCKTSAGTSVTPIATPTSSTSAEHQQQQQSSYVTARASYSSSLLVDAGASAVDDTAAAYMAKAAARAIAPRHTIVA